ncbi:MAG: monovalent cation/H+ antiporter complex subunit F [Phycisphaerales bacterium]
MTNLFAIPWRFMLALGGGGGGVDESSGGAPMPESAAEPALMMIVDGGMVTITLGMALLIYRMWRGPHLADRVLAADALSLHVVGLVILLTIRLESLVFIDAALVVAIIGFASTLAFAQYIGARRHDSAAVIESPS